MTEQWMRDYLRYTDFREGLGGVAFERVAGLIWLIGKDGKRLRLREVLESYAAFDRARPAAKPTFPVGTSVLLVDEHNKILLGERQNCSGAGMFSTPGGRVEPGESLVDCAVRETLEETGLIIDPADLRIFDFREWHRFDKHYFTFYCEVRRWTGELRNTEPEKCKGWEWWPTTAPPANCTEPQEILDEVTVF